MRKASTFFKSILLITTFLFANKFARAVDPSFTVYIDNAAYVSNSIFEFDIMVKAAGPTTTFELRTFQAGIWVNPTWAGAGTVSLQNVSGSSQMTSPGYNGALMWNNTDKFINCAVNVGVKTVSSCISSSISSSAPVRVTRLRMTTSTSFNCASVPDLKFNYVQSASSQRLHTSLSWRINGTCAVNYEMFYPARPYGGQAYFNGELWSLADADGKSPASANANSAACATTYQVTAFVQGFYDVPSSAMTTVMANQMVSNATGTQADTFLIQFRSVADPSVILYSESAVAETNGLTSCTIPMSLTGQNCWIVVNHRNSIQTWSNAAVMVTANGSFNFSTSASQAFGDNQIEVAPGVYAMFSGDVNQDGFIGGDDVGVVDNDNLVGLFLDYFVTDVNGDGFVGGDDVGLVDNNNLAGVFAILP